MLKQKSKASAGLLFLICAVACVSKPLFAQASGDQAITPLSILGTVTELKADTHEVVVTTAAGSKLTVTLSDSTVFMRIPPGEKTKDKFIRITATDFGIGDSVFARGRISEDRKTMPAREFYVMSKGEIADKRYRERESWRTRGIAGTDAAIRQRHGWVLQSARQRPRPMDEDIRTAKSILREDHGRATEGLAAFERTGARDPLRVERAPREHLSGERVAVHADRTGLDESAPAKSWNSSHPSRGPDGGCSQNDLKSTGGAGLLYCFATK